MEGKRVDSKLMLFTLVLVLITLLLLNYFLVGNRKDDIWDYENLNSASSIIYLGESVEDRDTYYILESIVANYIESYVDNYSSKEETQTLTYMDYYKYLTDDYKKYLRKNEYSEVAKKFLDKFYVNAKSEYEVMQYMDVNKVIKAIYEFDNNVYLCEVESSYNKIRGYIAIKLDTSKSAFNIVYIE